jgi:drug/metabolite transporter (DMT)-like permease
MLVYCRTINILRPFYIMTPTALLLIGISAFTHAFWNFLGKRQNPTAAFFLIASLAVSLFTLPVLFYYRQQVGMVPGEVWTLLLFTGICQAVYYIGLAGAYRYGQLSVAYPLARALPALLIALVTGLLGIGRPMTLPGFAAILVIVFGCLLIPMPDFRSLRPQIYLNRCCALALLAAFGTTGYTLIDSEALRMLRAMPALGMTVVEIAVLFMALETAAIVLVMSVYVNGLPGERAALRTVFQTNWRLAAVTGLIISGTYLLVLAAMAYVTNVSYLAAFRQVSIPLGALLGITFQKEPAPLPKITGIGLVFTGLVILGFA